jgi:hypothetical protein
MSTLTQAISDEQGWKLVPIKVTNGMIDAANAVPFGIAGSPPHWQWVWDAMLAAAPAAPAQSGEPVAKFDDPLVQSIYEVLCGNDDPPMGEHWEGWVSRRIVDALELFAAPQPAQTEPAADAQAAVELSKLHWLDQSTADPIEKARRVLRHLIVPDAVYFHEDGFPRCNTIACDAGCVLEVLNGLAARTSDAAPADTAAVYISPSDLQSLQKGRCRLAIVLTGVDGVPDGCVPLHAQTADVPPSPIQITPFNAEDYLSDPEVRAEYEAEMVAPIAPSAEPVAWLTPSDWNDTPLATADESVMKAWRTDHRQITPAYAAHPALTEQSVKPVAEWQSRYMGDPRQPGCWERSTNYGWAKAVYERNASHTDEHGWQTRPLYAHAPAQAADVRAMADEQRKVVAEVATALEMQAQHERNLGIYEGEAVFDALAARLNGLLTTEGK